MYEILKMVRMLIQMNHPKTTEVDDTCSFAKHVAAEASKIQIDALTWFCIPVKLCSDSSDASWFIL